MSALFLAPHNDDEALFGAYLILRHQPHVIVCLFDTHERVEESRLAVGELGATFEQWKIRAHDLDRWDYVEWRLRWIRERYSTVFAPKPWFKENGHSADSPSLEVAGVLDHDVIGQLALKIWGKERVTLYQAYTRWEGRVREGTEVIPEHGWIAAKLRALSHYVSQQEHPPTASWFVQPDLREWIA